MELEFEFTNEWRNCDLHDWEFTAFGLYGMDGLFTITILNFNFTIFRYS